MVNNIEQTAIWKDIVYNDIALQREVLPMDCLVKCNDILNIIKEAIGISGI